MGDPLVDVDTVVGAYAAFADVAEAEQTRRIAAATASIEAYVGRPLGRGSFVEKHRPESTRRLYLRATPVESIASITVGRDATAVDPDTYEFDAETGVVDLSSGYPAGFRYPDRVYGGDVRVGTLTVTYVGGWATEDMPADLQQAAILTVMSGGATLALNGGGLFASEQLGEYSYRLSATGGGGPTLAAMGLPPAALGLVSRYRRVRFV